MSCKTMNIDLANVPPVPIQIGVAGENAFRTITFDASTWGADFPDATYTVVYKRADGYLYPVLVNAAADGIVWNPTDTDTAVSGNGQLEVRLLDGETIGKTIIMQTFVAPSLSGDESEPSTPAPDWVNDVAADADRAEAAVSHYPTIVNGVWFVWDAGTGKFVSTGISAQGEDGYSPIVTVTAIDGGHRVTITDATGPHTFDVMDGDDSSGSGAVESVNGKTGVVVLDATDVHALPDSTVIPVVPQMATAADMSDWTSGKTVDAAVLKEDFTAAALELNDLSVNKADRTDIPTAVSEFTNDSGFVTAQQAAAAAPVQSVNGMTGAVVIPTGSPDAVLYTAQTLTDAQQEQARSNIGAIDYSNLNAVVPEQYGAVGDGETDDTAAVRAALKASIDDGKTLFLPNKYYVTESLLTSEDYASVTLKIVGASPSNQEQYSIGAFGGIKFLNGIDLFSGLKIRGSMHCVSFMPVSRTQTGSIFNGCLLSKFTFDSCFVSNVLAFCHNTNVSSTSRIKDSTFLSVYYFAKCDAGNKSFTDSTIQNCYINGGMELNDNNCFEWYNWNGSNVTGNFIDYYRTIYCPILSTSGMFQAPVSANNQYQVFRYFYFAANVTSFQFQSESDCFNWNNPSSLQKLADYTPLTYTGRDSVMRDIPPYILLVTEEGAVEINHAVIHNNIGNIVFIRRGLGNYAHSRARMTCSLRDHRIAYENVVQVADSIYGAGMYRDNLVDIPFVKEVTSLPTIGLAWSVNYPGMRVRYNKRVYRYMWLYNGTSWVATWVDEALGAYKTSMLENDSGYQTAAQVQTAISPLQTKAITDTGGYYTTDTVEGALQEIGAELAGVNTLIGSGVIS